MVHGRGAERLSLLVRLVGEESRERRAGRDLALTRLVELLLIEALRSTAGQDAPPGYGSASAFSTAFSRHVGQAPGRYARERRSAPPVLA